VDIRIGDLLPDLTLHAVSWPLLGSQRGGTIRGDLRELIQDDRRAVRLASGAPLSPDEQAEERRLKETNEMNLFVYRAFGLKVMIALKAGMAGMGRVGAWAGVAGTGRAVGNAALTARINPCP